VQAALENVAASDQPLHQERLMPRSCIAAVLVFLALLAPTASARVIDGPSEPKAETAEHYLVQSERITDTGGRPHAPLVQSERITDHRGPAPTGSLAGTTDETTAALAQERSYASQGDAVAALVREQESTSGSGNQSTPAPEVDGTPWAIVALGIAGGVLIAGGLTVMTRRTRARVAA
jgi:hypothetical protein